MEKKMYIIPQTTVMPMKASGIIMVTSIGGSDGSGLPSGPGGAPARRHTVPVF